MAKSLIFSSTILFFLLTSTFAHLQVDLPENDFTTTTAFETVDPADLTHLPESNIKTTKIILPSEKPETEPATYVELEPEETETIDFNRLPQKQETETETEISASENEKTETVESVPLTVVTFRPIKKRPLYRFGRGRGCHGRRRHRFNQLRLKHDQGQRQDQTQGLRSYGNDMILSRSEDLGLDRHVFAKWPRFSHEAGSFMNKQVNSEEINIKPFHHHHHRFHHHHDHHEEEGEMKEHHRHDEYYFKGGFMKGIRKFLNHF